MFLCLNEMFFDPIKIIIFSKTAMETLICYTTITGSATEPYCLGG